MVTDRLGRGADAARRIVGGLVAGLALLGPGGAVAPGADAAVRLGDARESGAFNVGAASANLVREGGSLRLDVRLPPGTAAGVWARGFPESFHAGAVDLARVRVAADGKADLAGQVRVAVELKGKAGTQRVPVTLGTAAADEAPILWGQVGELNEVVVAVEPAPGARGEVAGRLDLDIQFVATPWYRKWAESPAARLGAAMLVAGLTAVIWGLVGRLRGARREPGPARVGPAAALDDFRRGLALVGTIGLGVAVFDLGARPAAEMGWWFLLIAALGPVVADLWAVALTGRHLATGEWLRDAAASGLLAASSSPLAILQTPGSWGDVLLLSQTAAGAAVVVYHLANARLLGRSGRHLGAVAGGLVVATPYVFGALVLLAADARGLAGQLGGWMTFGQLGGGLAEFAGRAAVLFLFNEAMAAGLGLATRRRASGSIVLHAVLLGSAVAAVAAPAVADYGSGAFGGGAWLGRGVEAVLAAALAEAGLWAEVYLMTGLLLDAVAGFAPTGPASRRHAVGGMGKGFVYSAVFLAILHGVGLVLMSGVLGALAPVAQVAAAVALGMLAFPLVKTIVETFDGSQGFFRRAWRGYHDPRLYARGAVVGLGLGLAYRLGASGWSIEGRSALGLAVGALAYAGVNLARDLFEAAGHHGRVLPARAYLVQGMLGGFIGAAIGFYLDATQVALIQGHFRDYLALGHDPVAFDVRPFVSKWGRVDLGKYAGGPKLLFDQSLAGVISWAVPAWLFAINRTFLAAFFAREAGPIRALASPTGLAALGRNMIEVLRWGLWMSPIINSFLRPMATPTWYNQDGAIRTLVAIGHNVTEPASTFQSWSLGVFTALLAYDSLRILIWLDHMGLRVATLVNLSFLGMDRLDGKLARFLRPASTARCIPEGVKRFTTWAPLLIPFYLPQGKDWDVAWEKSNAGNPPAVVTLLGPWLHGSGLPLLGLTVGLVAAGTGGFAGARVLGERREARRKVAWSLTNPEYALTIEPSGAVTAQVKGRGYDLTRRSYDGLDPAGRALFVRVEQGGHARTAAILGQFPGGGLPESSVAADPDGIAFSRDCEGLVADVRVTLPDPSTAAELWTVTLTNRAGEPQSVGLVPYLEWVLNRPDADRGHTQYNRLFAEMEYAPGLQGVLAWDKHAKSLGYVAADVAPSGFLSSRMDFIGRARSLRSPRILETMAFSTAGEAEAHPTFDPIAALRLDVDLEPGESRTVRLLVGYAPDKAGAIAAIARHLQIPGAADVPVDRKRKTLHRIGHGEVPPGTPQPYSEFSADGRTLRVLTPFTPRPVDHVLSNGLGHVVALTNRGFQTTSSGNSQQNRLTPDWPDTVTREVPPEAFYLFEPATGAWFSPTYHPLNDPDARYEVEFGVDGTATYRMAKGDLSTELTVFVPPDVPAGIYLLKVRNRGEQPRALRIGSYFQLVLGSQPEESAGSVRAGIGPQPGALYFAVFDNRQNHFREGQAFAAVSAQPAHPPTVRRGAFFGPDRDVRRPARVARTDRESNGPDGGDDRPVAAFVNELTVPPGGESSLTLMLGQADNQLAAARLLRAVKDDPNFAAGHLESTRRWWLALMDTVRVESASPEFDRYLDWIKYQALAERIWARRGFYQASGAFGFRDQLQDSVNLIWMDPAIARRQIVLHASQQFLEGDVVHWFHRLGDGRTGFAARTHASDNLLWLGWAVVEYVGATGDLSLLDESTPYLEAELPFGPLPKDKGGMGFDPLRSSRVDSVYRHCLRAIDLVLDRRMGAHGLPLIGTGDWNDGLDEIGAEGRGESVWLGFFLHYILQRMAPIVGQKDGAERQDHYLKHLRDLGEALDSTWRDDRYLRAIHDDGTEIGVKGSGVWEIDALTAAWAVMAGINPLRERIVFQTALEVLEQESTIMLGWPPLREDTHPYLGRSSGYPEGVRENGMYCHGVQWLVGAARLLADRALADGRPDDAARHAADAHRLWLKVSSIFHTTPERIETFGGQPNKQSADMVTTFDPGRMIWHGYTGAAGWMFRQAIEGVLGYRLVDGSVVPPDGRPVAPELGDARVTRDVSGSPFSREA